MESDFNRDTIPSFFPFDVLPLEIQSRILGLLPITTLLICKAVSPSWRSLIRSPAFTHSYRPTRDPIFLLFSDENPIRSAFAYLPSVDRWIRFPFSAPVTTGIASTDPSSVARTLIFSDHNESGQWSILDVELPISLSRCHLLSFGGDLYLTARTRQETPSQIGIWKLDQSAMIWWEFDFKPSELSIGGWFVVDCMGMISYSGYRSNKVLMCDLVKKRWWYLESSNVPSDASPWQWVGRTVEPPIDLVY